MVEKKKAKSKKNTNGSLIYCMMDDRNNDPNYYPIIHPELLYLWYVICCKAIFFLFGYAPNTVNHYKFSSEQRKLQFAYWTVIIDKTEANRFDTITVIPLEF